MTTQRFKRRSFLRLSAISAGTTLVAACAPQVIKETVVVEKPVEKVVTQVVKETVIVAGTPMVEEKVVEKLITVAPAPAEPVKVTWWNPDALNWQPAYKAAADAFMETTPSIEVEINNVPEEGWHEKVYAMIAGGAAPDVWVEWYAVDMARHGFIQNLSPYMDRDGIEPEKIWFPLCVKRGMYQGQHYSTPRDGVWTLIGYNKDLLDEFGVSYPEDGWTFDDFLSMNKAVTDVEKGTWGNDFAGSGMLNWDQGFCWNLGFELVSEDGRKVKGLLDSPTSIEAIQWVIDLEVKHKVAAVGSDRQALGDFPFASGKTGFGAYTGWGITTWGKLEFNWGAVPAPIRKGKGVFSWGDSVQYYMWSACPRAEEAWQLMKYISGPEGGIVIGKSDGGWMSPCPESWLALGWDQDPLLGLFWAEAQKPTFVPNYLRTEFHWACVGPNYEDIWTRYIENGERPLEAIVADAAEKAQTCLDEKYASEE